MLLTSIPFLALCSALVGVRHFVLCNFLLLSLLALFGVLFATDPFYMVRSLPANATDSLYCSLLGQSAVHGAMAGYSGFSTGIVNGHHVMLPMTEICNRSRTRVDVHSRMWHRVLACTNQPSLCGSKVEEVPVKESGKPAKPMAVSVEPVPPPPQPDAAE